MSGIKNLLFALALLTLFSGQSIAVPTKLFWCAETNISGMERGHIRSSEPNGTGIATIRNSASIRGCTVSQASDHLYFFDSKVLYRTSTTTIQDKSPFLIQELRLAGLLLMRLDQIFIGEI